ncbi:MAG: CRISPR-associated endonuclease Cas1, partial [Caldisericaceae bacterium]
GINVIFMNKSGSFSGKLTPGESKNIFLRINQFALFSKPDVQVMLGKVLINAKIRNSIIMLKRFIKNTDYKLEYCSQLELIERKLHNVSSVETLRGFEGEASAIYFKEMKNVLSDSVNFEGRSYYPARDQFNGLLNFLYGLISHEMLSLIESKGFDPYLGFFHSVEYGRVSLIFDLIEPFRAPIADAIAVKLFRKKEVDVNNDFENDKEHGFILKDGFRKLVLVNYEEKMENTFNHHGTETNFRKSMISTVESLRAFLENEREFDTFYMEK